jgi:hypothetical protein
MKRLIVTLAALSLMASGPAFAGCGSHGGGYSRAYGASSHSAPRQTVERKVATAKTAKATPAKQAGDAFADADSSNAKLPKQAIAAVEALAGANTLAPVTAEVARECKQYLATIGALISVACE